MKSIAVIKLLVGIILIISALQQILAYETWWFIQNVNLIFHEAGHVLLMFLGNFIYTLGGSFLEIAIPCLVTTHFVRTKQFFSAACTCWWLATAFLSVSIYANDAQLRAISLISNDISTHDWHNLLVQVNLLEHAHLFGYIFVLCALLAVALSSYFLSRDAHIRKLFSTFFNKHKLKV